ncbi:hypothetical protein T03_7382 [Trichinella britovi]|uniref:Uncharacterized protein n=1 Tax=Trichinella britovi TaxID=45882 RepID=A0A0V1B2A0_TRIBR|nr:hypothetical protein T03_7382 [Trichinella britovi]
MLRRDQASFCVSLKSISYANNLHTYRDSNPDMTIPHNPRQV